MRILLVIGSQVNAFPPVRNVIELLLQNGHKVTLMARDRTGLVISSSDNFTFIRIPEFESDPSPIAYIKKIHFMRKKVKEEMQQNDYLWTATDATVRDLGDLVLKYKHIMQLMELIKDIPLFPGVKHLGLNIQKYARHAYKVVVPEYNRAHIQKAWWNLDQLPTVLPNKMSLPIIDSQTLPDDVKSILQNVTKEKRKIVLYQGVFNSDRELEGFIQAVSMLGEEYVIYLMGNETEYKKKLCELDKCVVNIPFIKPPYHLLITQHAYIGLLPYKAASYLHYDIINALYCAPNKIFEYAAYGVPMIGTDVPGLHTPFSEYHIGYTCQPCTVDNILSSIRKISDNYEVMKSNCKNFYESVDMEAIIEELLQES